MLTIFERNCAFDHILMLNVLDYTYILTYIKSEVRL